MTLKVLAEDEVYHLQWWDLEPKAAPAVGSAVDLEVTVRAYVDKKGAARVGLGVRDGGREEVF